jgi:hypothetical protein
LQTELPDSTVVIRKKGVKTNSWLVGLPDRYRPSTPNVRTTAQSRNLCSGSHGKSFMHDLHRSDNIVSNWLCPATDQPPWLICPRRGRAALSPSEREVPPQNLSSVTTFAPWATHDERPFSTGYWSMLSEFTVTEAQNEGNSSQQDFG